MAVAITAVAAPAAPAASTPSRAVLAEGVGMRAAPSVRVRELQRLLVRHGYRVGSAGVDGRFGPRTRAAVRRAQAAHDLKVDGVVGRATRRALQTTRRQQTTARRHATTRKATTRRQATTRRSSHQATVKLRPVTLPAKVAPRPASAAAPVHLSAQDSGNAVAIIVAALVLGLALMAVVFRRQHRRYDARLEAYRLRAVPAPTHEPAEEQLESPAPTLVAAAPAPPPRSGLPHGSEVIGCVTGPRVSPASGRTPERNIERACERFGWQLLEIVHDDDGSAGILDRPILVEALARIASGEAKGLVVNDARMLSRSADFARFVQWFRDSDAALIALDMGLDTSTPEGHRVASALITLNGWAGKRSAARTREPALEIAAADTSNRLPVQDRTEVLERIAALHESGLEVQEIADQLNDDGVRTLFGTDKWWPSTVQTALRYWRARSTPSSLARRAAGGRAAD